MIIVICEAVIDPAKQKEFLGKVRENMAALQAHMKGANFAAFGKMSMEYGIQTEIKLYQAEALN